ncbi:MAG TPA: VWA domain-containing protein, partial [Pyrinomonadaceae bacterium]
MFRLARIALSLSLLIPSIPVISAQSDAVHIEPRSEVDARSRRGNDGAFARVPELHVPVKPLRVDVDLVLVPVTVTNTNNQPVMNLGQPSFEVYENDKPQEIRHFYIEDSPISVGLLLDVSRSMRSKIEIEKDSVREFFNNANPEDDYFAITFASRPKLLSNPAQSIGTLESRLGDVDPNGNTALLDAVSMGIAMLRTARYRRKALLIFSDGGDNNSRYRLNDIKSLVQESDVTVYAIGIADEFNLPLLKSLDEKARKHCLDEITHASGGRTIMVDNLARVADAAATISREMRTQYVLGYKPS